MAKYDYYARYSTSKNKTAYRKKVERRRQPMWLWIIAILIALLLLVVLLDRLGWLRVPLISNWLDGVFGTVSALFGG